MTAIVAAAAALLAAGCASGAATSGSAAAPHRATTAGHHRHAHRARRHRHGRRRDRGVPTVDLPRRTLTPGAVLTTSLARICVRGYSAGVRNVPEAEKADVYARYGVVEVPYAHEVDHLVSLEIGGSNAITNLWPEPYAGRWGARTKDVLEDRLHELVCDGRLGLRRAQRIEARNWVAAYRRYVGAATVLPAPTPGSGPAGSAGGYYASSYPTASTIYCADDPGWRGLSSRYLVHFRTYGQATGRFPGYHLHRPC